MGNTNSNTPPDQHQRQLNYSFNHLRQHHTTPPPPTYRPRQPLSRPAYRRITPSPRPLRPHTTTRTNNRGITRLQPPPERPHSPLPPLPLPPSPQDIPRPVTPWTPNTRAIQFAKAPPYQPSIRRHIFGPSFGPPTTNPFHKPTDQMVRQTRQQQRLRQRARRRESVTTRRQRIASLFKLPDSKSKRRPKIPGVKLGTYNMQDGRNTRLLQLARNLEQQNVDILIATEAKIPNDIHTRHACGFDIFCTYTTTKNQGGLALFYRTDPAPANWHLESLRRHGPNVLSAILVSADQVTPIIGAYLPPSHLDDLPYLTEAFERFPTQQPLLLGDLNADLSNLRAPRTAEVFKALAPYSLEDHLLHFKQRKKHSDYTTWYQYRSTTDKTYRSRCDYILGPDRRLFQWITIKNPRYFTSDHHMLLSWYRTCPAKSHKAYLNGRRKFPLTLPKIGPLTHADTLYERVLAACPQPELQTKKRPQWLAPDTLKSMDTRCALRRNPKHDKTKARQLTREINRLIKRDRKRRTEEAGQRIQSHLEGPTKNLQASYGELKRWYRHLGDRPPKPSRQDLQQIASDFTALYKAEEPTPPGEPIPIHVQPAAIDDSIPTADEIKEATMKLRNHRAAGHSKLTADTFKKWIRLAYPEEYHRSQKDPPPPADTTNWDLLVELTQHIFRTGEIPTKLTWQLLAVLPKPDGGTRGIGLIEHAWKICEKIIQLRKYGVGKRCIRLLRAWWTHQQIVPRQNGFHGPAFRPTRGVTQGGIPSPDFFNILVDAIIREWLQTIVDDTGRVVKEGFGRAIADRLTSFYADDGLLASTDAAWLQGALDVLVDLFRRCGLRTNVNKTKTMICYPGARHVEISPYAYKRRMTGEGLTVREKKRRRTTCPECNKSLSEGALRRHLQSQHHIETLPAAPLPQHPEPQQYTMKWPKANRKCPCPVMDCPGILSSYAGLRIHFMRKHPQDTICIRDEGSQPLPRCRLCGMHVTYQALNTTHPSSHLCIEGQQRKLRRQNLEAVRKSREVVFTALNQPIETVTSFRYLGRILSANNNDWPAVHKNIIKARQKWAHISRPL
eukprot:Sro1211_g252850.1 Reverse transcriptase (RNA-dependent DNA polymerase) (1066) ;mRNA; f:30706-34100